jgi:hypothetical protein
MNKNIKLHFVLSLMLIVVVTMMLAGCVDKREIKPPKTSGGSDTPPVEEQVPAPVRDLVLSYLSNEYASEDAVYFASDEPEEPREGDLRIDSLVYIDERVLYETIGVAYKMEYSRYWLTRENKDSEGTYTWHQNPPSYVVLNRSGYEENPDRYTWDRVMGISYEEDDEKKIEDIIFEIAYGLLDIDVSVNFDHYPGYMGPGSSYIPINEEWEKEILEEYEPIYSEGDYWFRLDYKGLTILCYHNKTEDVDRINWLETVRTDLASHRGIRIGMSREQVISAYPTIYDTQYWGREGDYLWYCDNEDAFGAALIFWFEDDMVTKIELIDMFN